MNKWLRFPKAKTVVVFLKDSVVCTNVLS